MSTKVTREQYTTILNNRAELERRYKTLLANAAELYKNIVAGSHSYSDNKFFTVKYDTYKSTLAELRAEIDIITEIISTLEIVQ